MTSFLKLIDIFNKYNLEQGRMISDSKSGYKEEHLFNTVCFNANIFIKKAEVYFKIWYGDLDISLEGDILKKIAEELKTTLYVVKEMDGRFKNENRQDVQTVSVWDTTMVTPFIDEEKYKKLMAARKKTLEEKKNTKMEKYKQERELSERLPKIEMSMIMDTRVVKKITVRKEELDIHLKKLSAITRTKKDANKEEFMPEVIFANDFLDYKIKRELGLEDFKDINYSGLWIGEEFNRTLNRYNKDFDSRFMSKEELEASYLPETLFEYSSYMSTYRYRNTNEKGYSNSSLEDLTIYVLEGYLKK